MSSTTPSSSPWQSALYQALPSLAEVSKFSSHACSTARTHLERLKTARRKENSEAANLADFALCCCNAQLAKREGLSWFSNFLRTLVRKSWPTVSNSPGALCRISSSVAGLIPGERTSATPRSVLQISDRHLRRYPIRNATSDPDFLHQRPDFPCLKRPKARKIFALTPHSLLKQPPQRKFAREPPHEATACTRSTWLIVTLIVRMRTKTFATVQQSFEKSAWI